MIDREKLIAYGFSEISKILYIKTEILTTDKIYATIKIRIDEDGSFIFVVQYNNNEFLNNIINSKPYYNTDNLIDAIDKFLSYAKEYLI